MLYAHTADLFRQAQCSALLKANVDIVSWNGRAISYRSPVEEYIYSQRCYDYDSDINDYDLFDDDYDDYYFDFI